MIRNSLENTPDSIHVGISSSSTTIIITLMSILGILMTMIDPITGYHEVAENLTTTRRRQSNLRLPTFIASHMVLQRGPLSARIWGWADPGANISIVLDSQKTTTINVFVIAGQDDGSWSTMLPPQPAGTDHTIHITDGHTYIDLEDIAFGDVYLCSGQSNMCFSMPGVFNATAEIEDSINYPNIRLATVQLVLSDDPQNDAPSKASTYTWIRSSPAAMSLDDAFGYYSATCYFFGRELHKALNYKVPIGLVTSSWGGQKIETFSSPEALADKTCGGTRPLYDVYNVNNDNTSIYNYNVHDDTGKGIIGDAPPQDDDDLYSDGGGDGPKSMQIWNAMIHPLINMRFTGAIWYQGESNDSDQNSYACRFPAMITDWRNKFDLPDLSFFFVQLAAYHNRDTWPNFRAAQLAATQLPKVGFATAIDIGDPSSPHESIHPRRKQEVGRRLALSVRSIEYGERGGLVYTGPTLAGVQFSPGCCDDSSETIIRLSFSPGTADNLHVHGSPECKSCCSNFPFQVLNGDRNWTRIDDGSIEKSEIVLSSRSGPVFGIRYAWEPYPQCLIYNGWGGPDDHTGLPSAPWEWCAYPSGDPTWSGNGCRVPTEARRYHIQQGLTETK